ncbi:unnamed protein product [Mucor hiemalis]
MQTTATPLQPVSQPVNRTASNKEFHIRNEQSLDYVVRSGIAGGIAGCIGKTVIAPLDESRSCFKHAIPFLTNTLVGLRAYLKQEKKFSREKGRWDCFRDTL